MHITPKQAILFIMPLIAKFVYPIASFKAPCYPDATHRFYQLIRRKGSGLMPRESVSPNFTTPCWILTSTTMALALLGFNSPIAHADDRIPTTDHTPTVTVTTPIEASTSSAPTAVLPHQEDPQPTETEPLPAEPTASTDSPAHPTESVVTPPNPAPTVTAESSSSSPTQHPNLAEPSPVHNQVTTTRLTDSDNDSPVSQAIKDPQLQAEIVNALNQLTHPETNPAAKKWSSIKDVTRQDLSKLDSLDIKDTVVSPQLNPGKTSYDLSGIELLTNLTKLTLGGNLNANPSRFHGDITDISPLSALKKLVTLDVSLNRISDVKPLSNLTNLKELYIQFNTVTDFSSLKALVAKGLTCAYQGQTIVKPLKFFKLASHQATLVQPLYLPDGTKVSLQALPYVIPATTITAQDGNENHIDAIGYLTDRSAKVSPDTDGNLVYTNLYQNPYKVNRIIDLHGNTVLFKDSAYLVGAYRLSPNSTPEIVVIQPYRLVDTAGPVTTRYVDDQGHRIQDDVIDHTGLIGDTYTTVKKTIPNYTWQKTIGHPTGKYTAESVIVTYVYTKNAPQITTGTVTVHYVTDSGKVLKPSETLTGNPGSPYATVAPTFNGYTLSHRPTNATGTFTTGSQTVTYVYQAVTTVGESHSTPPTTPPVAVTPAPVPELVDQPNRHPNTAGTAVKPVPSPDPEAMTNLSKPSQAIFTPQKSSSIAAATLPQTNETTPTLWLKILGVGLSCALGWFMVTRRH